MLRRARNTKFPCCNGSLAIGSDQGALHHAALGVRKAIASRSFARQNVRGRERRLETFLYQP
jgi:hypothetical protein